MIMIVKIIIDHDDHCNVLFDYCDAYHDNDDPTWVTLLLRPDIWAILKTENMKSLYRIGRFPN